MGMSDETLTDRLRQLGLARMVEEVRPDGEFVAELEMGVVLYRFRTDAEPRWTIQDMGATYGGVISCGENPAWAWMVGWHDSVDARMAAKVEQMVASDPVLNQA